jgi:hypothetical protein
MSAWQHQKESASPDRPISLKISALKIKGLFPNTLQTTSTAKSLFLNTLQET